MNTPLCQAHAVENQWITAVFLIATCQHQCHSLWLFIGPQQGHCSAVSSSILGDWWTRPCPGLKGTLSPPMKREISLLVPLTCPAQSKKSTAQHISAFSLCSAVQPAYMFRLLPFLLVREQICFCWWLDQLPGTDMYPRGGKLRLKNTSTWWLCLSREPSIGF